LSDFLRKSKKNRYNKSGSNPGTEVICLKIKTQINPEIEDDFIVITAKTKENLKRILDLIKSIEDTIEARQEDQISQLRYSDILYFESVDKKTFAYTNKSVYEISQWPNEIEESMPKPFFRCSKTTIINLSKVMSFSPSFGSRIIMNLMNGEKIAVSRKYVPQLQEKMKEGKSK
jgi:DNA-binding LytR/AlgR family response regulator